MSFGSVGRVLHEGEGTKDKANVEIEDSGEMQYEWLLAKLEKDKSNPKNAAASLWSSHPYQREYAMYVEIFEANIAKKGLHAPRAENVFHTPIWADGNILFLDYDSSETSSAPSAPPADDTLIDPPVDTSGDDQVVIYPGFNTQKYFFGLNYHYYRNKNWFRCIVDSFWGPQVKSVFQVINFNRPFIQIAFKIDWNYKDERRKFYYNVIIFLHIIARLRPIQGVGPLTNIFGFSFVNFSGKTITEIEAVERLGIDKPEGEGYDITRFAVRHRIETWRSQFVTIKD
ncbi:hypothetical protein K445DRAFT_307128 [Daldinia sp. EC12]|nr:hypothetical protein K445DRAFT_307128 [Daldinia sp. EC12]